MLLKQEHLRKFSDEIKSLLPKDKELKILSLGKAASSMAEKMADMNISQTGIVVTNDENFRPIENFTCLQLDTHSR